MTNGTWMIAEIWTVDIEPQRPWGLKKQVEVITKMNDIIMTMTSISNLEKVTRKQAQSKGCTIIGIGGDHERIA